MAFVNVIHNATGYDELMGGPEIPTLEKNVTFKKGAAYLRGMLVTSVTETSGTVQKEFVTGTTKGGVADYVVAYDKNAVDADTVGTVYTMGLFNREKLIVAEDDTADAHEAELRTKNIHLTSIK